jgi:hypothetical protein
VCKIKQVLGLEGGEWASVYEGNSKLEIDSKESGTGTNGICAFLKDHKIHLKGRSTVIGTVYEENSTVSPCL